MKFFLTLSILLLLFFTSLASPFEDRSFSHKIIFSETPEIGRKWHGGLRWTDILIFDGFLNLNGWAALDFVRAGVRNLTIDNNANMEDYFSMLSLKARPFSAGLKGAPYKIGGGIKLFSSRFSFVADSDSLYNMDDGSLVLFLTQSWQPGTRHYINLFTSLSFRNKEKSSVRPTTYYFIPGYKFALTSKWSVGMEYYMTDTERLPIKLLQLTSDYDKLEFHNRERAMYSFMFWGFQYAGRHVRWDLSLASHISFQYIMLPIIGFGWNF